MSARELLNNFISKYPEYEELSFLLPGGTSGEKLHPLFILTQYIIDSLIEREENRVAIVMPDNMSNIVPMIIAKYFILNYS